MLEVFTPYLLFISFFITVIFNLWLISKNANWVVIIIANLLLVLIMEFLGLAEYSFLNKVLEWIFNLISDILSLLWDNTIGRIVRLVERIFKLSPDTSYGGGGGGFRGR